MALSVTAAPAFGQKVSIAYDRNYDASHIETFAWRTTPETSVEGTHPLLHSRILEGLAYYITMNGAREVQTDPAVWVTYHASTTEQLRFDTTTYGYGYPGAWYGGYGRRGYYGYGGGTTITTVSTYELGTLVVDLWDAKTDELVWRGTVKDITLSDGLGKMTKRIDKALKKMVRKWQKIKEKNAS